MCKTYFEIKKMDENKRQIYLYETEKYGLHSITSDVYLSMVNDDKIDPTSRWYAIKAIGEQKIDQGLQLLIGVLKKNNVTIGETSLHLIAASSIGKLGDIAIPYVTELLHCSESTIETQLAAVDALGEIRSVESIPVLIEMIKIKEFEIALWAGLSLSKIGEAATTELMNIFATLPHNKKIIVLDTLMRIEQKNAVDFVVKQLYDNNDYFTAFKKSKSKAFVCFMQNLKQHNAELFHYFEDKNNE